jgi:hypothetical protein
MCTVIQATNVQNRIRVINFFLHIFCFISCSAVIVNRAGGIPRKEVKVCVEGAYPVLRTDYITIML